MSAAQRAAVAALAAERDALEAQRDALLSRLHAPGQPGVRGPLVDGDGFPRADVDVHAVRSDRHALALLSTAAAAVAARLEAALYAIHADAKAKAEAEAALVAAAAAATAAAAANAAALAPPSPAPPKRVRPAGGNVDAMEEEEGAAAPVPAQAPPFALVASVAAGSPAADAGMLPGDWLVSLSGGASLASLPPLVVAGRGVEAVVLRAGARLQLALVPRPWAGRGLLGCHLVPRPG